MTAPDQSHRVEYFELFFDLIYVFTLIQITRTIAYDGSVTGIVHGLVVLVLVWWVWVAFTTLANMGLPDGTRRDWRPALFAVAMGLLLLIALSVPEAFWADSLLFAFSYLGLSLLAMGGQLAVTRRNGASMRPMLRMTATAMVLPLTLVISSFIEGNVLSVLVLLIGFIAAAIAPLVSGLSHWSISKSHLAERYALFMLITMGETIISLGEGATKAEMSTLLVATVLLSFALVVILWRHYATEVLQTGERRLHELTGVAAVKFARFGYTYLHLFMVAGLVLAAAALKTALTDVTTPLGDLLETMLAIGVGAYLLSTAVFTTLTGRPARRLTLVAIAALTILAVVSPLLPSPVIVLLVVAAAIVGVDPRSLGRRSAPPPEMELEPQE